MPSKHDKLPPRPRLSDHRPPEIVIVRYSQRCIGHSLRVLAPAYHGCEAQLQTWDLAAAARAVLDNQNLHLIAGDAVDHPVALHEDLADVVKLVLGHNASTAREEHQSIRCLKHLLGKAGRLSR